MGETRDSILKTLYLKHVAGKTASGIVDLLVCEQPGLFRSIRYSSSRTIAPIWASRDRVLERMACLSMMNYESTQFAKLNLVIVNEIFKSLAFVDDKHARVAYDDMFVEH